MTPCDRYQEQISALMDGELNTAEQRTLAEHVRTCPECRRMYTAFRGVSAAISDAAVEPPADLTAHIMQQVHAAPPVSAAPQVRQQPVRRPAPQPAREAPRPARQPKQTVQQMPRQTAPESKAPKRKRGRISPLVPIGTIAACLVLIVGAVALFGPSGGKPSSGDTTLSNASNDKTVVSPAPEHTTSSRPATPNTDNSLSAVPDNTNCVVFTVPEASGLSAEDGAERRITDPDDIRRLSELLICTKETDPVPNGTEPVCVLQDTDANGAQRTCTVWLIGSDIVFRTGEDGPYYLTKDAADAFRQLLNLQDG